MIGSLAFLLSVNLGDSPTITLNSLLAEMCDRDRLARFPNPPYQSLQASSYNRESTHRDKPGWFADSDGTGYIREETINGKHEYVMMEHTGPGCITKMWTPFFYYDFNNRVGPNVRIYLDGSSTPTFDESLIKLVRGEGSIRTRFARPTARAGDSYLPIPFAKSVKVTMVDKPFYNIINYRAYPEGTAVETFRKPSSVQNLPFPKQAEFLGTELRRSSFTKSVLPGGFAEFSLPNGSFAIEDLKIQIGRVEGQSHYGTDPDCLRSTVLSMSFDSEETVWCPIGDFFSNLSADSREAAQTWTRTTEADGLLHCRWIMPFKNSARIRIHNFGTKAIDVGCFTESKPWKWTKDSMHFYARWRPDDIVPGTPFQDWNFVDIQGKGVFVGDAFTVLNIRKDSWWGEGDEKIYVDDAWAKGFPTHFGTGTEDYYGWAGGVYPTKEDNFHHPFLNNKVGGIDGHTMGYNILTRERSLDAIPFSKRLRFDMESSFGTDMREKWNLLGYSAVTFFYALPGTTHNRPAMPDAVKKPIMAIDQLQKLSDKIRTGK
ncbi:MAG: glycoside hydrolase family 172 protein [Armatimonadota bacterium]